jgi:hypothetical protein
MLKENNAYLAVDSLLGNLGLLEIAIHYTSTPQANFTFVIL